MRKKARKFIAILLSVLMLISPFATYADTGDTTTGAPDLNYLVSDFESSTDVWYFSKFGTGTVASYTRTDNTSGSAIDAHEGSFVGIISINSSGYQNNTGGSYATLTKILKDPKPDANQVSFWLKSNGNLKSIGLQVIDSTGEVFQRRFITVAQNTEWQQVKLIDDFDAIPAGDSWNGNNNNVFDGPMKGIAIVVNRDNMVNTTLQTDTYIDYVTLSVPVVDVPAESVSLSTTSAAIEVGNSTTLTATVLPVNTTNKTLEWSSSNTAVATVDVNGKVSAIAAGTATVAATVTGTAISATCDITVSATEAVPEDFRYLISDFESSTDTWTIYQSGTGTVASYARTMPTSGSAISAHEGSWMGTISLDSSGYVNGTGGSYASITKTFLDPMPDAKKVSFWLQSTNANLKSIGIQLVDSKGEKFQHRRIPVQTTSEWQQIKVTDAFDSVADSESWGGDNNNIFDGPLKALVIVVNRDDMVNNMLPTVTNIDYVTADAPLPEPDPIVIVQTNLANIYHNGDVPSFPLVTEADTAEWIVTDFLGNVVDSGVTTLSGVDKVLTLKAYDIGYYELSITGKLAGEVLGEAETIFGVLGQALDLTQVTDSPFGVGCHFGHSSRWPVELIPLISELGIKHVRDEMVWSQVERVKGTYTFNEQFETYMQALKGAGIDPLIIFNYVNSNYDAGAAPTTEEGLAGYTNYAKALLEKYDQIRVNEIWNEFNIYSSGDKTPQSYYGMMKALYPEVKAVYPDTTILAGGTAGIPWGWLETLFQQEDVFDYMDGVSIHPYRWPGNPDGTDNEIERLRNLIKTYNNGESVPIWVTEWGWPTHNGASGVSEEAQAAYLAQSTILMLAAGVEGMYWYDLMNDGVNASYSENNFGLVRAANDSKGKFALKPAFVAYAALTRELTGAEFVATDKTMEGVSKISFTKNNAPINVLWSSEPTEVSIQSNTALTITDIMGRKQVYTPVNNWITYTLTSYPIYVEGQVGTISKGGMFSMSAKEGYLGDPIEVTFKLDNSGSETPRTATFRLMGTDYVLTAPAGQLFTETIELPGYETEQTITLVAEVFVGEDQVAILTTDVNIIDPLNAHAQHIIVDGTHKVRVYLNNLVSDANTLSRINWTVGNQTGTVEPNLTVPGRTEVFCDLELPTLAADTIYNYELTLILANEKTLQASGKIRTMDPGLLVPIHEGIIEIGTDKSTPTTEPTVDLTTEADYSNLSGYAGETDLSGKLWLNWDEDNLYMAVSIKDDVRYQSESGSGIWQGDSIQFSVSTGLPGETIQIHELGMALTQAGAQLYRWAGMNGAEPGLISEGADLSIKRDEATKETLYLLKLSWDCIPPIKDTDTILSFSILANDNDGSGRRGWLEWGSGIGTRKDPALFKPLQLVASEDVAATSVSLSTTSAAIEVGKTTTLTAIVLPANTTNKTLEWTSSNTAVATVDVNGEVTAIAAGTATITVKVAGTDITNTCTITVNTEEVPPEPEDPQDPSDTVDKTKVEVNEKELVNAFLNSDVATIEIPKIDGASSYVLKLPASAIASTSTVKKIEFKTELGIIIAPTNMLKAAEVAGANNIEFVIAKAETSKLDVETRNKIGHRPVVEINLKIDDKVIAWKNPEAPVIVQVPYTPTKAELAHPEHIVVWYIDGAGRIVAVPTGKYNAKTGMVTFTITHFSKYAAAYVSKTFEDINNYVWAKNAIEVMASKGVISGTAADKFTPSADITRADFIIMLIKALGLSANVKDNFADVKSTAYYSEAVGIAKTLGIAAGVGNNKFNPEERITRQDMMVLISKAMKIADRILSTGTSQDLDKFADAENIAGYAAQVVSDFVRSEIVSGDGTNINPKGNATRAETAVMIYKLYNK